MRFADLLGKKSLLVTLVLIFFSFLMAMPSLAAEKTTQGVLKEELPPGEPSLGQKVWDHFLFIANGDAFFTLSRLDNTGTLGGGSADALLAPTYKFNDRTFFILMYDGHYFKKRDFYSDEVGPRERSEFQAHTIQPMFRKDFGPRARYSLTPSVFMTYTFNKDIDAAHWGDGLYNYRDLGGSLQFDMREVFVKEGTINLTAQYYKRRYPNYASLLSLTGLDLSSGLNVEKNEKDYHGVLVKGGYSMVKSLGFSFQTQYALLQKDLDDKKVVGSDGVLTSEGQKDYLHTLDLNLWDTLDVGGGLKLGLDLRGGMNRSNQNYYDGMETIILSDDEFTPHFYDYFLYRISPNISYTFPLFPLTATAAYAYQKTRFTDRKATFKDGSYKSEFEKDTEQAINFRLSYELSTHWSLVGVWEHIMARSNYDDQRVYRYDYTINNYSIGIAFKY
jgi:hypothetical protein